MHLRSLLLVMAVACGGSGPPLTPASTTTQPAATTGVSTDSLPIAQYLGSDRATGARVFELLHASGIQSSAGGSLGFSVWVDGADRARAREVLLAAASNECLAVTIFDDRGQQIPGTQPARCAPPTAPAPTIGPHEK